MRVCSSCGTLIPNGASACPGCGAPVGKAASAAGSEAGQELHGTLGTGRGAGKASVPDPYKNAPIHTAPDTAGLKGSLAGGKTGGGGYSGGASGYTGGASGYTGGASGYTGGRVYTEDNSDYDRGEEEYDEYEAPKKRKTALWIILACTLFALAAAMVCVLLFVDFGGPVHDPADTLPPATRLSDSCGYVLCEGTDSGGNFYELVASQTDSASGVEITVGVIRNNQWYIPMSSDSPFLNGGRFPVMPEVRVGYGPYGLLGSEGEANVVRENVYFLSTGGFLMNCIKYEDDNPYSTKYNKYAVILDCNAKMDTTLSLDHDAFLLCDETDARFYDGKVSSYGKITVYDNQLVYCTKNVKSIYEVTYSTYIFNVRTFAKQTVKEDGEHAPMGPYAEGLILFTDDAFYNQYGSKQFELPEYYEISSYERKHFVSGEYQYTIKNSAGTKYLITIDTRGKVLREEQQ